MNKYLRNIGVFRRHYIMSNVFVSEEIKGELIVSALLDTD
ncbi:hypothetical protein SAMN05421855_102597 [Ulvibacter litoralis]|uniref:Uncharacterized protein n=1 Tax=Ulvibacter litoralis TaxID=227084 RepID=A0A1G7FJR7_9FLAO|nr:hypothetical protein SAMN05421855_102597 [Ulvibacter litoralis]